MTYKKLLDLKYLQGISTYELVCRYPDEIKRVSEVALLEVSDDMLNKILSEKKTLKRIKKLKKKLVKIRSESI
jgi:hypothetical protein